jgi:hypothetical protein
MIPKIRVLFARLSRLRFGSQSLSFVTICLPFELRSSPKIQQESHLNVTGPQIIQELRFVSAVQHGRGLQLNNNEIRDDQIRAIVAHHIAFIKDYDAMLRSTFNPAFCSSMTIAFS